MRTLLPNLLMAVGLTLGAVNGVSAAPVAGSADYATLYSTAFAQCTVPAGSVEGCEAAINAYSGRLIADGVALADANASFTALRSEVLAANAADAAFQAQIDALFEELLPDSGAVGGGAPVVDPGPAQTLAPGSSGSSTGSPT